MLEYQENWENKVSLVTDADGIKHFFMWFIWNTIVAMNSNKTRTRFDLVSHQYQPPYALYALDENDGEDFRGALSTGWPVLLEL
jgi:hypothetical protein